MKEPASFDVTGVMSFPRIDFEVDLSRELARIGATIPEAQAYVEGLRRGGALAFATGSDEKVDAAAKYHEPARCRGSRRGHWFRAGAGPLWVTTA